MGIIKLVRIDFRLIHGQIVNKWIKAINANKIIFINDAFRNDDFMADIYIMAAPPGVEVEIYSVEEAAKKYVEDQLGSGDVLILFKNVKEAYECYKKGLEIKELQIGGLGAAPGRKVVFGPITLDKKDADTLLEMEKEGVRVYMHQVPEDPSAELDKVLSKVSFD